MRRQRGFSLIELVAVMALLGIVAVASTVFISSSVGIYSDTARRSELNQQGRYAVERISREMRAALPNSARVASAGGTSCVEFLPVVAASTYLTSVAGLSLNTLTIVEQPQVPTAGESDLSLVIFNNDNNSPSDAIANNSIYDTASAVITGISDISSAGGNQLTVTFDGAHTFNEDSPQRRVFIVDSSAITSFCASEGRVSRHQGYSWSVAPSLPPGSGDQIAGLLRMNEDDGSAITPFEYTPGTLQRSAVVYVDLRFSAPAADGFNEWVRYTQEIFLRNVP